MLVIAPLRVGLNSWPTELEKWSHLKDISYSVAIGSEAERKAALLRQADIYIINRLMSLCQSCHTKIHHEIGDR